MSRFAITAWFSGEPYQNWRRKGFAHLIVQTGQKRDDRFADVPSLYELLDQFKTGEVERRTADVVLTSNRFGRPYVAPPGISLNRIRILREAFMKTLEDGNFSAEAKTRNLEIKPTRGKSLEKLARQIVVQPIEVVDRVKRLHRQ